MYKHKEFIFKSIFFIFITVGLYLSSLYNYLLFHSVAEMFCIVIGFSLFTVAWHSRKFSEQKFDYLLFIGISYFFISFIDLIHTLSYTGIAIFNDYDYYASQLWIAARYLESISLLIPFIFIRHKKKLNPYLAFCICIIVTTGLVFSILYYKVFPVCYIEGQGQTQFKINSEYIICLILFFAAILMRKNKNIFDNRAYKYLLWSIGVTIVCEYTFTLYLNVYDFSNLIGHYLKIISFYLIYKAIIIKGITEPFERACNELKERKKALRMYKNLFNSIDECFGIIAVSYNDEGELEDYRYDEVNHAFEKETGVPIVEGKLVSELTKEYDKSVLNILNEVVLTGEPIRTIYEIKPLKTWYSTYFFKIDQEENSRVVVLFRNITEEIKEKSEMEQNIKMQNEIFANVSHELRTPLSVIFTTIQLLEVYLKSESIELVKKKSPKCINIIKQNCYRFTRLINNVVDLSKIDLGFFELNIRNENIVKVVENTVIAVSQFIHEKKLNIIFNTDCKEKIIGFDSDKIERVLLNLISNAIKFSNNEDTISVEVIDKETFVEISVKDNGVGIEKKHLNYIFDRFYQADKTLCRNAEGIGIGLALAKSITEIHGGRITAESKPGKGSIFRITLPIRKFESFPCNKESNTCDRIEMIRIEFSDIYNL